MRNLAYRRHQRERMIARAKQIIKGWGCSSDWIEQAAPRWADNMKKCSCWMCCNPRRNGELTLQEERFNQEK